jgi:S1-C subfamily serine protease
MTTEEVVARSEGSVAMVRGRKGHGTGFLVRDGLVVTNAHVVGGEAASDLEVTFPSAASVDRGPFPAKLVYRDTHRDIALLLVASKLPPLELDDSPGSKRGRDVVIIGCPGIGPIALENAIAKGVMGPRVGFGSLEFDQLTAAINPGNSGGPVIDTNGKVVGVATLMATQQQSLALCIPASEVAAAVTRHVAHPGVSVAEPPRDAETFAFNPISPAPSVAADALLSPPNDDPTASPAVRLASCDAGALLPEAHPKVKAAADLLESTKLLFRQDDRVIVDLVIDVVARLRERRISARASDALSAMVECAPTPDSPEKRRDAAVYALLYFRCKSSSQVHAEAILCMRKSVEAMERNGDKLVTGRTRLPIDPPEPLGRLHDARGRQRVAPDPRAFDDPGQYAKPAPTPDAPVVTKPKEKVKPRRELAPPTPAATQLSAALRLEAEGDRPGAIKAFQAVIDTYPDAMQAGIARNRLKLLNPPATKSKSEPHGGITPRG